MLRILLYVLKAAILVGVAVWLAEHPGRVAIDWEGWRVDTNIAVLAAALAVVLAGLMALSGGWRLLRDGAGGWRRKRAEKRQHRGYLAFTQGMIALAAGDTAEARRQANRTRALSDNQPLGLLLRAQAAQIDGDHGAAQETFRAMLDQPETEFLGLRGLTAIALREDNQDEALRLASRAHELQPAAHWAIQTLADSRLRRGEWSKAWDALDAAQGAKLWDKAKLARRRALVLIGLARQAQAEGQDRHALTQAEKAVELAVDLIPATILKAEYLLAHGRPGKAAAAIERIWTAQPHPDLARVYLATGEEQDPLSRVKRCQKLLQLTPNAAEAHLAMAEAARAARLWGEARSHYRTALADGHTRNRACLGLAAVEEADHGDQAKAMNWLREAAEAPAGPAWRCDHCGSTADVWQAHCPSCGAIDGLRWEA